MKKRLLAIIMATLMFCFATQMTVFATESTNTMLSSNSEENEIRPYGSLSGYAYYYHSRNDSLIGSFTIEVTGSWSPYAGWTLKTDFPSGTEFDYVYLTRPNGTQIGSTLYPSANSEISNQLLLDVPMGTYTVYYRLSSNSSGTIQVWIY